MKNSKMVNYILPCVVEAMKDWKLMRDICAGERQVKEAGTTYLVKPNAKDTSVLNNERYAAYIQRAVFYAFTKRTVEGFIGQIFEKDPTTELPIELTALQTNADGEGSTAIQFAKRIVREVLTVGRVGMLVDFPKNAGAFTVKDVEDKKVQPTLKVYLAEDIINWRMTVIGAKLYLAMVVLAEAHEIEDGDFGTETVQKYRVLKLVLGADGQPAGVSFELHAPVKGKTATFEIEEEGTLTMASGNPFLQIPFSCIGAENNCVHIIDKPPLLDMANLNVHHYGDSADFQESLHVVGQPTFVVSGLTEEWYKDVLKGQIRFGSRGGIPLPENATAMLLQAEPNNLPKEGMEMKERQAVAIGAKLVEQKAVQRTATEASMENSAETSVIGSIVGNVNVVLERAVEWAAAFIMRTPPVKDENGENDMVFELASDFSMTRMTADELSALVAAWQQGALGYEEVRHAYRRAGYAFQDDDDVKAEADEALKNTMELTAAVQGKGKPPEKPGEKKTPPAAE